MAHKTAVLALALTIAASPAAAQDMVPAVGAPEGTPETLYCMRIEAITGSRLEKVKCWTRDQWAANEVDVDKDWAKEGVRTIG